MTTENNDLRLDAIESRLDALEKLLQPRGTPEVSEISSAPSSAPAFSVPTAARSAAPKPTAPAKRPQTQVNVSNILGWGGAFALILAASYLIRLAIDSGWLTPMRQVAFASVFGFTLIGAGFFLRKENRQYAGLLPAAGIAVLFLSVYGAHLHHHIISLGQASAGVIVICAISLLLCREFESDLYAIFAVAGSYSAPFLLHSQTGSITNLAVYYSAWSMVFCVFSVLHGRRMIYLLAVYLALIGFDVMWQARGGAQDAKWVAAMAFQTIQFGIFALCTAVYSMRRQSPLSSNEAIVHLPPLVLFYSLQYTLLDQHLPAIAPWIAVASLAAIGAIYGIARATLSRPLPGGEFLLWAYASLVLFHAGYIETIPREWAPWVALIAVPVLAATTLFYKDGVGARWPMWWMVGIVFMTNYLRVMFDIDIYGSVASVPGGKMIPVAYAVLLYAGYWFYRVQKTGSSADNVKILLLYMGHVSAMAAAVRILNEPIVESAVWGVLAIGFMILSGRISDKPLAKSTLAIFAATGFKVMLFDLSGAPPVTRIVVLAFLGVAFYFGGLMYQRLLAAVDRKNESAEAPAIG
jgi:hypothetical protein